MRWRGSLVAAALVGAACRRSSESKPLIVAEAIDATVATETSAMEMDDAEDAAPNGTGDCFEAIDRHARLEGAWGSTSDVTFCLVGDPYDFELGSYGRKCFDLDVASGEYRHTKDDAAAPKKAKRIALPLGLSSASASGKVDVLFTGGARTPAGAKLTLRDAKTHATLKSATPYYDEHLAFDGWIGDAIVLRTWVDEGPGCTRVLLDPVTTWPPELASGTALPGCYGAETLFFSLPRDRVLVVGGGGEDVAFVDAKSETVTALDLGAYSNPDEGFAILADDASKLVVVHGGEVAGDVAVVDLDAQSLLTRWSPKICAP